VQNEKRDDGSRFEKVLQESPLGPTLFIFDNFETVYNPIHLFNWLDTYIRLPNKILITTRSRQFRADYPIEVKGMEPNEAEELIGNTASHLGIASLITTDFRAELLEESDGHPYVIKILLGEVAKARRVSKVKRIVASQEDILDALFERTYLDLSLPAQRVFLTVSGWRSAIAVPALEAVLLRPTNDKIDVQGAVDELRKCSFIDISDSESDDTQFITVPLVAAVFGNRKLSISPWKSSVELDLEQLQIFGAASSSDIRKGMAPRIRWLFSHITNKVLIEKEAVHKYEPVLQYVATRFPDTWLDLAELYRALGVGFSLKAIEALNSYLQSGEHVNTKIAAWNLLADLYGKEGNTLGEVNAIIEACKLPGTSYRDLSEAANRLNRLSHENRIRPDNEASLTLVRQLASLMRERIESADATSCSRLAWIYILLRDEEGEIWAVNKGYELEPENFHIAKMARRLGIGTKKKF
jgi:hypothetical protein